MTPFLLQKILLYQNYFVSLLNNLKTIVMQRKGYYTGKRVFTPFLQKFTIIGKISGYRGNGEPVYDLLVGGEKVGEMGNPEVKKNRKTYYDLSVISRISIPNI